MRRRVEFFVVETATSGVEMRGRVGRLTRRNEISTGSGNDRVVRGAVATRLVRGADAHTRINAYPGPIEGCRPTNSIDCQIIR